MGGVGCREGEEGEKDVTPLSSPSRHTPHALPLGRITLQLFLVETTIIESTRS